MFKSRLKHPILGSSLLARLAAGNAALRDLERRFPQLLSNRKFKAELEMEMLCSDRTAAPLTLILFRVGSREGADPLGALKQLARIFGECTRKTDRKGWFCDADGICIGMILVHTPPEKARRIIQHVQECYKDLPSNGDGAASDDEIRCEIFSYPPYQTENSNGRRGEDSPAIIEHPARPAEGNGSSNGSQGKAEARVRACYPSIVELLRDPMPFWKRTLDVSGALAVLVIASPLLVLIALAVKLSSAGPVFFKQDRVGYRGRIFKCWKFRSMRVEADPALHKRYLSELIEQSTVVLHDEDERPMLKLDKKDSQITPLGRLLRVSCLDEFPQLINVLKGEMSLVGPRPCLPYEAEKYQRWHFRRLDTVPGMTGLWQVKGKNKVPFRKMIRLDILYTRQCSLWLDVKILLQTVPAILREIRDALPAK